jgi:hypothetical protein
MRCAIHQPNFFPRLSTLAKLFTADAWVVLDDVQFSRRDYQHRCRLAGTGATRPERWLTVPVHLPNGRATLIHDVRLAEGSPTPRRVAGLLHQYYRRDPHWPAIRDLLPDVLGALDHTDHLADVSECSTTALLRSLGWTGVIRHSSELPARTGRSERLADLTAALGATSYLCGTGGARYLDPVPFTARGLGVEVCTVRREAGVWADAHRVTALTGLGAIGSRALSEQVGTGVRTVGR